MIIKFFRIMRLGLVLGGCTSTLQAYVFNVVNTNDGGPKLSLRRAIQLTSQLGGNDTIKLDPKPVRDTNGAPQIRVMHLTRTRVGKDKSGTGDLDVTRGKLTIISPFTNVVIDASELGDRVFKVFPKAQLTLQNLTITGGQAPANDSSQGNENFGGAILNAGSLTLINCRIIGNVAGDGQERMGNAGGDSGGDAGGIYNIGTLKMTGCFFTENVAGAGTDGAAGGNGGAVKNDGTCWMTNCIFSANRSGNGGGPAGNAFGVAGSGGGGGAIFNSGTMLMIGCVVTNNASGSGLDGGYPGISMIGSSPGSPGGGGGDGAGIYNSGTLTVLNSTLSGNICGAGGVGGRSIGFQGATGGAGGSGGGLCNLGIVTMQSCVVKENIGGDGGTGGTGFPDGGEGGQGGQGSGICSLGPLTLISTVITNNTCGAGGAGGAGRFFISAPMGGNGGGGGSGGGVFQLDTNNPALLQDTLVEQNLAGNGGAGGLVDPGDATATPGTAGAPGAGPDLFGNFVQ